MNYERLKEKLPQREQNDRIWRETWNAWKRIAETDKNQRGLNGETTHSISCGDLLFKAGLYYV